MTIRIIISLALTISLATDLVGQSNDFIQESRYKPFRILIISPDKATIHDSLRIYIKPIEDEFKSSFYKLLREHQEKLNSGNEEERAKAELAIQEAKKHEADIVRFKYYHRIAIGTFVSLQEYFKKFPWEDKESFDCQIVNRDDLKTEDFSQLTKDQNFDYVIYFSDIIADKYADGFIMDLTTYLFSKTDSKVIMKKKLWKEGPEWYCETYQLNLLDCLMKRVGDDATSELFDILDERQKK